jgi:hypothetical protein
VLLLAFKKQKKEMLDLAFIKNVYPPWFDNIEFLPSIGASGVLLVAWKSSLLEENLFLVMIMPCMLNFTPNMIAEVGC